MVTVNEISQALRAEGPATVLAIGTATPPNCVDQSAYPDFYFCITNSEHCNSSRLTSISVSSKLCVHMWLSPTLIAIASMGNILLDTGVSLTIGLNSPMKFFMRQSNFKGMHRDS